MSPGVMAAAVALQDGGQRLTGHRRLGRGWRDRVFRQGRGQGLRRGRAVAAAACGQGRHGGVSCCEGFAAVAQRAACRACCGHTLLQPLERTLERLALRISLQGGWDRWGVSFRLVRLASRLRTAAVKDMTARPCAVCCVLEPGHWCWRFSAGSSEGLGVPLLKTG